MGFDSHRLARGGPRRAIPGQGA